MNQRKTVALLNDNESNTQTYKIVEFEKIMNYSVVVLRLLPSLMTYFVMQTFYTVEI